MSSQASNEELGQISDMNETIIKIVPALIASILGLLVLTYLAIFRVMRQDKGSQKMIAIANSIKEGAKAFLHREYIYLAVFVIVMYIVIGIITESWDETGLSFLLGASLSAFCGYCGMLIAVEGIYHIHISSYT